MSQLKEGYWTYETGKTNYDLDAKDLAFLRHPKTDYVTDFRKYETMSHIQTE